MLAFAVALWMAGAGCLLGCENNVASASTNDRGELKTPVVVDAGDACASAHSPSCCSSHGARALRPAKVKQSVNSAKTTPADARLAGKSSSHAPTIAPVGGSSSMMNCPLAMTPAAALAKSGPVDVDGNLAVADTNEPLTHSLDHLTAFVRPPRSPNGGHTYLRCCVFLI